jgi:hypothetical protein
MPSVIRFKKGPYRGHVQCPGTPTFEDRKRKEREKLKENDLHADLDSGRLSEGRRVPIIRED